MSIRIVKPIVAASLLGIKSQTLRDLVEAGYIKPYTQDGQLITQLQGSYFFYDLNELAAFFKKGMIVEEVA